MSAICALRDVKKKSGGRYVVDGGKKTVPVRSYQKTFSRLLENLGIAHKGFHALRHTFATRCFEKGMDPKVVQKLMAEGDERAAKIYETIGVYFGYAVAYYALFYDIKHVLLMGRVSSGEGGSILHKNAEKVLAGEFPELAEKITIHLPDESSRRVGQSIAAASLPLIK